MWVALNIGNILYKYVRDSYFSRIFYKNPKISYLYENLVRLANISDNKPSFYVVVSDVNEQVMVVSDTLTNEQLQCHTEL